ncbi:hypothetical protein HPP92_014754 [Vanilla planifolia]|uniref:HECT-type E3 ubiquitin transferase n=1 Tax=Vanilla planifolia TaxID=51239 RepID=A0A835QV38_VANPL|nr:hypothetical protein HPP92_015256 [Vanilla planifolia]KAG0475068.1 hypothetical protein HPP92_014754 [Vanilla planifolia]
MIILQRSTLHYIKSGFKCFKNLLKWTKWQELLQARFGLFSQTSTTDGNLVPKVTAGMLDNGMAMIEFLGRIVGKALYEEALRAVQLLDELSTLDAELYRNLLYLKLLSGGKHDFDVEDLRCNTRYTGGYTERSRTIKIFWEVVKDLKPSESSHLI